MLISNEATLFIRSDFHSEGPIRVSKCFAFISSHFDFVILSPVYPVACCIELAHTATVLQSQKEPAKPNKAEFGGVVLFCCSSQLSILCKTQAMLKLMFEDSLGVLGGCGFVGAFL